MARVRTFVSIPLADNIDNTGTFCNTKFGIVNACSVANKTAILSNYIHSEALNVFVITEKWHENAESVALRRIAPPDFDYIEAARPILERSNVCTESFVNHGGIAIVFKRLLNIKCKLLDITATSFEYLCGYASVGNCHFIILGLYRPRSGSVTSTFFTELTHLLERLSITVVLC